MLSVKWSSEGWTCRRHRFTAVRKQRWRVFVFLHNQGRYTNLAWTKRVLATVQTRFIVFLHQRSRRCRGKGGKGRNHHVSRDLKNRLKEREEIELERSECWLGALAAHRSVGVFVNNSQPLSTKPKNRTAASRSSGSAVCERLSPTSVLH